MIKMKDKTKMEKEKTTTVITVYGPKSRHMFLPPEGYDLLKTEEELNKHVERQVFRDLNAELMSKVLKETGYREIHQIPKGYLHKFTITDLGLHIFYSHVEGTIEEDPDDRRTDLSLRKVHFYREYYGMEVTEIL